MKGNFFFLRRSHSATEYRKGKFFLHERKPSKFLNFGVIEQMGKTRGMKFVLSQHYYVSQGKSGLHTRLTGLEEMQRNILSLSI